MLDTAEKNKIKPDTILKNFWRDNRHFADLFNAVFFNGEQVLKPQCKKIFTIMGLGITGGMEVVLKFDGEDEDAAYEKISAFMKENL